MSGLDITYRKWKHTGKAALQHFYNLLDGDTFVRPDILGPYEPLEYRSDDFTAEVFAELILKERSILANTEPNRRQAFHLWNLPNPKKPNSFYHGFENITTVSEDVSRWFEYGKKIFRLFEPDFGKMGCHEDYFAKNLIQGAVAANAVGIDLRQYLPGIYWANFFGPRYIEFFGEERLLTAPAHKTEWLGDAGILLLVSDSPFDYDDPEVKETEQAVVEHLGADAFFFKSDPEDKKYRQPDLSDLPQFSSKSNGRA